MKKLKESIDALGHALTFLDKAKKDDYLNTIQEFFKEAKKLIL